MPEKGFKSITVPDTVYEILRSRYEKNKQELLEKHGITSISGYLVFLSQKYEEQLNKDNPQQESYEQ